MTINDAKPGDFIHMSIFGRILRIDQIGPLSWIAPIYQMQGDGSLVLCTGCPSPILA